MKQTFTTLLFFIAWSVKLVSAQTLETFESQTNGATTFVSNSVTFNLGPGATSSNSFFVANLTGLGYNASNKFAHVNDSYGETWNINVSSGSFKVSSLWLYITGNAAQDAGVTSNGLPGSVTFTGKLGATTVFTVTKTSGFATTYTLPGNGFALVDFATEGGTNNSNAIIDKLEIQLSSNYDYFAIDNFTWNMGVVPVTLTSFTAAKTSESAALLKWTTASEINNERFIIERSADGKSFSPVAEIKGGGNSAKPLSYSYQDKDATSFTMANHSSTVYYRLKQVDFDGKVYTYETRSVRMMDQAQLRMSISPNPFINELTVAVNDIAGRFFDIEITDLTGKTVFATRSLVDEGHTTVKIQALDALNKGIYFVAVKGETGTVIQRIVKTN